MSTKQISCFSGNYFLLISQHFVHLVR